jgi:chromosome segregation protein
VRRRAEGEDERKRLAAARAEAMVAVNRFAEAEAEAAREAVMMSERVRGAQAEMAAVVRSLAEQDASIDRLRRERDDLKQRAEEARTKAAEMDGALAELHEQRARLGQKLQELAHQTAAAEAALEMARQQARATAETRERIRGRLHALELRERELMLNAAALRERARDEIQLEIDQALPSFDAASAPPPEEVEQELVTVREKVARIGNVNLDAIDELAQVEQRLDFLTREREDLRTSRSSLEQTVRELDAVSRTQFMETFEAVREHFRALFRKLFHGGRADVSLVEGVDVLDAGIEIVAAPPGKDARTITLLSGGERTMTAIALLFALFKAKPAPIAVLDEVDAALDEANIERFCSLLSDFIGSSQFLIVSHSKRTMSYADVIIGVTMQESGVSSRIAIQMDAA